MVLVKKAGSVRTVDETLFRFLVELEVAKAQRLGYCVSVISITVDSLSATEDLDRFAEGFADRIRSTDTIAPCLGSSWVLLLVDAQPRDLSSIVRRLTEQLGPVPWSARGASYPRTAVGAEDLLRQAFEFAARAEEDSRLQQYLR